MRRLRFSGPIAAVALVYAATLAMLPSGGLWIVDNGNKRIQVEALLASGFRDFSLPWPGRDLDPELAFNPLPNAFSVVRDGRLYSELWRGAAAAKGAAVLLALLAAGSVALQLFSIDLLRRKLLFGERLEQAVRERPEAIVVTDAWWVPQTLAHEFFGKAIFYISTPEQERVLLGRLAQRGSPRFLFVTADAGRPPDPRVRVIDDEGLGFFSLRLEPHSLPAR